MKKAVAAFSLMFLFISSAAWAARCSSPPCTYYVDFVGGSNSVTADQATSTSTPVKTCPGDQINGSPSNVTLGAGDTVCFKGGVLYAGKISVPASGTSGSPIVFDGQCSGWGTGQAILTNSYEFTNSWTQCPDAATCGGNANYANIFYATRPAAMDIFTLFEGDTMLYPSQQPNPTTPFNWSDTTTYTHFHNDATHNINSTSIKDATNLTSSDSAFYNSAYVAYVYAGNNLKREAITGFDPDTDTISFTGGESALSEAYYAIVNNIAHIDYAGEYAVTADTIYLWPISGPPANMRYGKGATYYLWALISGASGIHDVTIQNFTMKNCESAFIYRDNSGSTGPLPGVSIIGNTMFNINAGGSNSFLLGNESSGAIQNNILHHVRDKRGILAAGQVTISGNEAYSIDGTGLWLSGGNNAVVSGNYFHDITGVHGDGVAITDSTGPVTISGNKIVTPNHAPALTLEDLPYGANIYNNILDCNNVANCLANWLTSDATYDGGSLNIINNTIVGSALIAYEANGWDSRLVQNNILTLGLSLSGGAGPADTFGYNCYTTTRGDTGDQQQSGGITDIVTDYANGDYTLKDTTVCKDNGVSVSAYLTTDYAGVSRPQGSGWDMGAYEIQTTGGTATLNGSGSVTLGGSGTITIE